MLTIPGYTLRGALKTSGNNLLFHASRDADGVSLIIKTPMASGGPRESERYRREYNILQRIRDVRGVLRAHACEQLQDRPSLLLEAVEGEVLSSLTGRPLEVPRVLDIAIALSTTLAEIHRRGVIHKDIKPSNIILTPSGEARLIDFGSATLQLVEHVDVAPTTLIEGTLAYMSPEQTGRMNRSVDYRTDFYSLGVTLYELISGGRPFHGRDALEWFHVHMAVAPHPLTEQLPDVPPVLSSIVLKLLAKVAEERYQSADGLKADLERCRDNLRRGVHEDFPPGVHDYPSRFQLPQRLYGRDVHSTALRQGFERVARTGRPEFIQVRGYSGSGKSAVVHELHKPVVRHRSFFLHGKFEQFQQASPYATLAQAIRGLTQQLLSGSDEVLARWRERLLSAWEGQGQLLVDVVPQLELVAGKQPPVTELPPHEAQQRFNRVFRVFLGLFATPEHPLVLFLDDLQWADPASLQLIHHLLTHPDTPPLLLIGAYRDNEVSPTHPLVRAIHDLRAAGARMHELKLEPLSLADVRQLVADALSGASEELVKALAAQAREKTGGNPFFLLHFMLTLHQDGLLVRLPGGSWRWDEAGIRARGYSDNVVDFLVGKLRQLNPATQHLLRLAACVGHGIPLSLLGILSNDTVSRVERKLEPAFMENLLVRGGEEQVRFIHDRVQQAAYALIPPEDRKVVHLRIGRLLLERLSPEDLQEKLFDVVSQFNAGAELLRDNAELLRVARLNAEAGRRAKASIALRSAILYTTRALRLLPGDPWEVEPALAFKLHWEQAHCEFMTGNATEALRLVNGFLGRAHSRAETASVYSLKTDILIGMGDIQTAVTCLLEGLALLGMPMSPHPSWEEVEAANAEVWALLGDRSIESLVDLPPMNDPDMEAVMSLLGAMYAPAFVTDTNLLILHLSRMAALSLRHGNTSASVHGYSWYGLVLGSAFHRYREGYAFGQLARELVERRGFTSLRGKALYGLEIISYWTQPLSISLELVREAFQQALQSSDSQVAGYCCNHIVMDRFLLGHDLEEVYRESVANLHFARGTEFLDSRDIIHFTQRHVQQLRGLTLAFGSMSGEDFDEETFEAGLTPQRMSTMRCWYWLIKAQSRYMSGDYALALECANRCAELSWSSLGHIQLLDLHLFRALALAACFGKMAPGEQAHALKEIRGHQRQLADWASHCPSTFQAPERLVSAELARITGQREQALEAYEQAVQSAREHRFLQRKALACELAARFWREHLNGTLAEAYARKAREAYQRWGAHGKVQHLESEWSVLTELRDGTQSTLDTNSTQIDALTVVKAQQAISGEIVLDRLVATLLQIAMENAGAQRGALLLPREDALVVSALSGSVSGTKDTPGTTETRLPWSVIAYVKRTREHVLIGDAAQPHPFSTDVWLEQSHARSVLCLPLLRQEEFRGVLYLENTLATNAFTPARITLLGHLASQAAISIENARLYADVQNAEAALRRANDELEKRVEERTRELKRTQARLVSTARSAGMAEIAANVIHNVGNVLTSAVINLQMVRETVSTSRLGRIKQVTQLLEDNEGQLGEFFARDPRGNQLPGYLSALAEELLREQASVLDGMAVMDKNLDHIRAIVQVQQTYAHSTLVTEECDLSQLIEDALSLQGASLQRHGILVTQEFAPVPRLCLDKHKVLQILIHLINNAKHAMSMLPESQRRLRVLLETEDKCARIQIVDNGMGIEPEIRDQLFCQGFTTRDGGHGLGLHSSALEARILGGSLRLDSDGIGKGATATLTLPLSLH